MVFCSLFLIRCAFIQVAIHAIGDKANDMVLDMYRSVISVNGVRDRRFRVLYLFIEKMIIYLSTHSYKNCRLAFCLFVANYFNLLKVLKIGQIEHAQHLLPSTASCFGQETVIPSVQVSISSLYSFCLLYLYEVWIFFTRNFLSTSLYWHFRSQIICWMMPALLRRR